MTIMIGTTIRIIPRAHIDMNDTEAEPLVTIGQIFDELDAQVEPKQKVPTPDTHEIPIGAIVAIRNRFSETVGHVVVRHAFDDFGQPTYITADKDRQSVHHGPWSPEVIFEIEE